MKYLIVGSYALSQHNLDREVKDVDIVCYKEDVKDVIKSFTDNYYIIDNGNEYSMLVKTDTRNIEILLADKQESLQYLLDQYTNRISIIPYLYALKMGHIYHPNKNWQKHMDDIVWMREHKSSELELHKEEIDHLIKLHRKSTKERIGDIKTPKLNKSKEEFFDDKVVKYYEHDFIHECMAHLDKPMFMYMQKDDGTVMCHKDLWDNFTELEKIYCVLEEAYVIALERQIIPTIKGDIVGKIPEEAFKWALMRICTTLCGGWFRAFAVNNYHKIIKLYNPKFYENFKF